jgi:hypothetical protein
MGYGIKKTPLETMGGNLPGAPVFRPWSAREAAQQRGRESNGKHPLKDASLNPATRRKLARLLAKLLLTSKPNL